MDILEDPLLRRDMNVIDSLRLPSGLTLAAPGAAYDHIWIRDNCYVGLGYWYGGQKDRALSLFRGLLKIMDRYAWKIDWILWEGKPSQSYKRIHPRYDANGFEIPEPWGFIQNDAIGLLLWCLGFLEQEGTHILTPPHLHLIQKLVWYLAAVRYWEDPDNGVWEEIMEVHASSVGCCVAGLKIHEHRVMVPDDAIQHGERVLAELNGQESPHRAVDLAQLTLIWPLGFLLKDTVLKVESELKRPTGVIRYHGDIYMLDQVPPGHTAYSEAEWTMGLPWLGLCWLMLGEVEKAQHYLDLTDQVRQDFLLPEAYIPYRSAHDEIKYMACNHNPLGWSHSLAVILRQQLLTVLSKQPTKPTPRPASESKPLPGKPLSSSSGGYTQVMDVRLRVIAVHAQTRNRTRSSCPI